MMMTLLGYNKDENKLYFSCSCCNQVISYTYREMLNSVETSDELLRMEVIWKNYGLTISDEEKLLGFDRYKELT